MTSQVLPAFPAFRLSPSADAATRADVTDADGMVLGQVSSGDGGHRGRACTDSGPLRADPVQAAEDVVVFHIALNGLSGPQQPYSGITEARVAVSLIPLQRQDLIDAAARAYFFDVMRQQHVSTLLPALDAIARERSAVTTLSGCRRIVRLLDYVREPARALLSQATGDERDWMALPLARTFAFTELASARLDATAATPPSDLGGPFTSPHDADEALSTAFRTYRDLQAHTLSSLPDATRHALSTLDTAATHLPSGPCAKSRTACCNTASALDKLADAAYSLEATVPPDAIGISTLARELSGIAADTSSRLASTALLLHDASRFGGARAILSILQDTELGPETDTATRSVRIAHTETGPIRRTPDGHWTGPGITQPYHSPEAAAAALVNAFRDRQTTASTHPDYLTEPTSPT